MRQVFRRNRDGKTLQPVGGKGKQHNKKRM
jgi:hypothetical protein